MHWLWKEWANVLRLRNVGIPTVGFTYSLTDQVDWDTALREQNGNVNRSAFTTSIATSERRSRLQKADTRLARGSARLQPVSRRSRRAAIALRQAHAREQEEEARQRLQKEEIDLGSRDTSAGLRMKIGKIETFTVPPRWLFVRVEADEGAAGWAKRALEGHAEAVDGAFAALRDRFIGHDPFRIEDIWQIGYRGGFYRGGPVLMSALAGLEQALWDLKAERSTFRHGRCWAAECARRSGPMHGSAATVRTRSPMPRRRGEQGFSAVKMNATAELGWIGTPKIR